jgi:hypothetical protein
MATVHDATTANVHRRTIGIVRLPELVAVALGWLGTFPDSPDPHNMPFSPPDSPSSMHCQHHEREIN